LLSEDSGESWREITNENLDVSVRAGFEQFIHRTVVMHPHGDGAIWATDDPVGPIDSYLEAKEGFQTRSKLVSAQIFGERIEAKVHCDIGMHVRSMVDIGEAFVIFTETSYPEIVRGPQIFIVFKDDLESCHHIADIPNPGGGPNKGTYSRSSIVSNDGVFFTEIAMNTYGNDAMKYHCKMLEWRVEII